jgi:hypothetical protein
VGVKYPATYVPPYDELLIITKKISRELERKNKGFDTELNLYGQKYLFGLPPSSSS